MILEELQELTELSAFLASQSLTVDLSNKKQQTVSSHSNSSSIAALDVATRKNSTLRMNIDEVS
jgi:hypothetical protein